MSFRRSATFSKLGSFAFSEASSNVTSQQLVEDPCIPLSYYPLTKDLAGEHYACPLTTILAAVHSAFPPARVLTGVHPAFPLAKVLVRVHSAFPLAAESEALSQEPKNIAPQR